MSEAVPAGAQPRGGRAQHPISERPPPRKFLGISALLFAASTSGTIVWCGSMSAMGGMPMPGGLTMSMTWMRMPGQMWLGVAASFLGMWVVMMLAMMLPALVPMLLRYRQAAGRAGETRLGRLTVLVAVGYFCVWTMFGMAVFPAGAAIAMIQIQSPTLARNAPITVGVIVLIAGFLQLSSWKSRQLARCRDGTGCERIPRSGVAAAWRHGVRLGFRCSTCCANLMAILLVAGVMDLRVMAVVTTAIAAERLAPDTQHVTRVIGAAVLLAGLLLIARAIASPFVPA